MVASSGSKKTFIFTLAPTPFDSAIIYQKSYATLQIIVTLDYSLLLTVTQSMVKKLLSDYSFGLLSAYALLQGKTTNCRGLLSVTT